MVACFLSISNASLGPAKTGNKVRKGVQKTFLRFECVLLRECSTEVFLWAFCQSPVSAVLSVSRKHGLKILGVLSGLLNPEHTLLSFCPPKRLADSDSVYSKVLFVYLQYSSLFTFSVPSCVKKIRRRHEGGATPIRRYDNRAPDPKNSGQQVCAKWPRLRMIATPPRSCALLIHIYTLPCGRLRQKTS